MNQKLPGRTMRPLLALTAVAGITVAGLTLVARPVQAQLPLANPYVAFYGGQARTNWTRGPTQQDLDWRGMWSAEFGFDLFGLTVSPGLFYVKKTTWSNPEQTEFFDLQFRSMYINIGAREETGIYFAGGLNWTFWDVLPQSNIPGVPSISADSEIGFQAFLGFLFQLEALPLKFMAEAGYAQFSGIVSTVGTPFELRDISSTGPMLRIGVALSR